ncbi:MAG: type II secretion system minor pseudopilin GspI [Burkholderiaceae bacterium]
MPAAPASLRVKLPAQRRGFTLLEVLIALVIIGVALAAAMRGAMALTDTADDTRARLYAGLLAENQLRELRLAREQIATGQTRSDCEQGGVTFVCEQTVLPTPNPFFRRIELRVYSSGTGEPRRYAELVGLLPIDNPS